MQTVQDVTEMIKADKGMQIAYQANIAMAFYDHYLEFKKARQKHPNKQELLEISNQAALAFLRLWCEDLNMTDAR